MKSVRNYTSFGPYRPVALQNHLKAKKYFEDDVSHQEKSPDATL
ncbi:hypothetical protein ABIF38_008820 [Bradyrhizobium japonicum]|jgi:hypothetical protein|nr:hypothetical protein [Bradyrhizobium elkanii]MCS3452340.1 hypothetical protein [Bradyrhizobium elkanii]MCS3565557.1 hypothetical protein [Bradyrhizobium elkanii]MCS3572986.1 hypothetical protein [Bradyrhizobium elkanii]MCS3594321.1 hypothetical protein [Bradyrhizobium elkanii]